MKYCSQCGKQMQDEDRFCMKCGSASGEAGATGSKSVVLVSSPARKQVLSIKSKIIIGALLVIVLAIGGFWGWNTYGTEARVQRQLDLAVKYLSDNDYQEAVLAFNDAINIDPKEVKAYQGLAKTYTLQGNYDQAKNTYEKGMAAVTPQNKQILQLGLAGMYIDQNKLTEAQQVYWEIMNMSPDCLEAYWGLAMVYNQQGDKSKAEAILKQAVEKNPNEYRGYNTIALFLSQNGKRDEALGNIVQSLTLEMDQQEAYLVLESMYQEKWDELRSEASSLSDATIAAMLEFYSYYGAGDYSNAITTNQSKLPTQSSNQKARILAAFCMVKNGDKVSAETIIKKIDISKLSAWLLSDLGRYYLSVGDLGKAREYAIKALQLEPANLDAIALLQTLSADDPDVKIYTVKALLYNWKPLDSLHEELQLYETYINMLASQNKNSDRNLDSASGATKQEDSINSMNSESGTSASDSANTQSIPQSVLNSGMFQWRGVKVGMTEEQVASIIGSPDEELYTQTGSHWVYGEIYITWTLTGKDADKQDTVRSIGFFKTLDNKIYPGDSYEELTTLYGPPNRIEEHDYDENAFYAIYENQFGMIKFIIKKGLVYRVVIGNGYYV